MRLYKSFRGTGTGDFLYKYTFSIYIIHNINVMRL